MSQVRMGYYNAYSLICKIYLSGSLAGPISDGYSNAKSRCNANSIYLSAGSILLLDSEHEPAAGGTFGSVGEKTDSE